MVKVECLRITTIAAVCAAPIYFDSGQTFEKLDVVATFV
jgi:hypothetical protein